MAFHEVIKIFVRFEWFLRIRITMMLTARQIYQDLRMMKTSLARGDLLHYTRRRLINYIINCI